MKYIYRGPLHAAEIMPVAKAETGDTKAETGDTKPLKPLFSGILADGVALDLPADHPQVANWLARGWLKIDDTKPQPAAQQGAAPSQPNPQPTPAPAAPTA
ncbi:MAG: hypothetical protein KGL46_04015 [Hyphomicrobiales bacterium]|nr:hypothetical protein [Hyphomicrobiales bacterium]